MLSDAHCFLLGFFPFLLKHGFVYKGFERRIVMNGFLIFIDGQYFDEVFFPKSMTVKEARASLLVEGYPSNIEIESFRTSVED